MDGIALLVVVVLAAFVGLEVVARVAPAQDGPLLAGTTAMHGVVLIGGIVVAGRADGWLAVALALVAVVLATVNLVSGFLLADRVVEADARPVRTGRRVAGGDA